MAERYGDHMLALSLSEGLAVPLVVGPMFLVSSVDLVVACGRTGVIGSIPTLNARTPAIFDEWLGAINAQRCDGDAPYAANLVVHASNARLEDDLAIVVSHRVPLIISSVGSPDRVIDRVKAYGGLVFSDAASIKHARRSAEAGADGLILLCAGAGGHTGWLNPFAFVEEVRSFFDGPIIVAGGLSRGGQLRAVQAMGADFGLMGTRFIAAVESAASPDYRDMLIQSGADDIVLTSAVTGLPANLLRASLDRAGFDPHKDSAKAFNLGSEEATLRAWRDIWGAGHGVNGVTSADWVAQIVRALVAEYHRV
jgi:nitronate monooxygenase